MKPPVSPSYPTLKNYTASPLVEGVQSLLNAVTRAWPEGPFYAPHDLIRKIGAATYAKLAKAGFLLEEDGKYGTLTAARVMVYQYNNHIGVDGIIGSKETWPALEKSLLAVRELAIRVAMTRLPNLVDANQKVSGGTDCGFFAAYAVAETTRGNPTLLRFTRADVLAARDAHDNFVSDDVKGKERTTGLGMGRTEAAEFLGKLGAKGFKNRRITAADTASAARLEQFLDARTNIGRDPLMMVMPNFLGPGEGHWIGILARQTVGTLPLYMVFDSSGKLPREMKSAGWPAGNATVWLSANLLLEAVRSSSADEVVSKH